MTDTAKINRLIARRERLTNRRDGNLNFPALNEIDAQLREVPAGERNDVDLLLGRACAVHDHPMLDKAAAIVEALDAAADETGVVAEWLTPKQIAQLAEMAETIEESPKDWRDMRGDTAL